MDILRPRWVARIGVTRSTQACFLAADRQCTELPLASATFSDKRCTCVSASARQSRAHSVVRGSFVVKFSDKVRLPG